MSKHKKYLRVTLALVVTLSCLAFITPATASSKGSQAVTQSYSSVSPLQLGMIVKLKNRDPNSVEALTSSTIKAMLGVVVAPNDATVTLSPSTTTKQQVFVATYGRYSVLVSNQNGSIHSGDYVTISSLDGVGMKADQNQTVIVGKASDSFDGTGGVVGTVTLKDKQGRSAPVSLARITVDILIAPNPLSAKATNYIPGFLSQASTTIADKPVSAIRIYLSLAILLISTIVAVNLLYGGIRSGMQAIGRNPLSKKSIFRGLVQTAITGVMIFIIGVFAVYLLLKL